MNSFNSELYILMQAKETNEYECVDIHKQPAFDNILLKNHKIQVNHIRII